MAAVGGLDDDPMATREYSKELGVRLRAVRTQQHLSLHGVERKSRGRWKAVVIGSYERGDRAISVQRLSELAVFYGVPVSELLPRDDEPTRSSTSMALSKIVLSLTRLTMLTDPAAAPLVRFVNTIQRQRGEYGSSNVAIRQEDLRTLGLIFETTPEGLTEKLVRWQVLAPESLILDGEP
jgi:transcriptional regulator with XRE-family HTH domain